jgi:hypothetical protein
VNDEQLQARITRALDSSLEHVPASLLVRLRATRRQAARARAPGIFGLAPAGLVALAAWLLLVGSPQIAPEPAALPPELLSADEALDFYDDLAFYRWLEATDRAG